MIKLDFTFKRLLWVIIRVRCGCDINQILDGTPYYNPDTTWFKSYKGGTAENGSVEHYEYIFPDFNNGGRSFNHKPLLTTMKNDLIDVIVIKNENKDDMHLYFENVFLKNATTHCSMSTYLDFLDKQDKIII